MCGLSNVSIQSLESGLFIRWETLLLVGLVSIYASTDATDLPEERNKVAQVPIINGQYIWNKAIEEYHYYFWVVPEVGKPVQIAQRIVATEGVVNFRDLGGYPAGDGKYTRWGVLFRSGAHDGLTEKDISCLKQLHLRTVIDYRSTDEKRQYPDFKIEGVHYLELPVFADAGVSNVLNLDGITGANEVKAMLREMNRMLVHDEQAHMVYAAMVRVCLQAEQVPMVQHCTAGKDRVGVGIATLLLLLGVSEDIVLDDYLLSNSNRVSIQKLESVRNSFISQTQQEIFAALTMVQLEYLKTFIDEMKLVYGTIENYAINGLGLTMEEILQLRKCYLIDEKM